MRGRKEQKGAEACAGNYERNIIYPKDAAKNNPSYVRSKLSTDFYHYERGMMPSEPLANCDIMVNTSWVC